MYEEGLVDASDINDFQAKVELLLTKWRDHDLSSSADMESFIQWFVANKVDVIKNSMLRPIWEDCGLGNPPDMFIEKVEELVAEQQKEVERAIINRGKYQLQADYRYLQVPESEWFTMTSQQRVKHINKVQSVSVIDVEESVDIQRPGNPSRSNPTHSSTKLSVDANAAAEGMNVPLPSMEGIWRKARDLIGDPSGMSPAPGQSPQARMVLSFSGKTPHMVTPTQGGGFNCDSNCPNWKSLNLCSHTVAVAELNGKLAEFITFVRKKKKLPNVTNLITSGMPRGRGRKGSVAPRTRKKKAAVTSRVPMSIEHQGTVQHTESSITGDFSSATAQPPFSSPPRYHHYPASPGYDSAVYNTVVPPYPAYPYPYRSPNVSSLSYNPYFVCFIKGNISTCYGCNNRYPKSPSPPNDMCLRHQEWRQFTPQGKDMPQTKYSNAYYHCNPVCVWHRNPEFIPSSIVASEIEDQLSSVHKAHLTSAFGLYFS